MITVTNPGAPAATRGCAAPRSSANTARRGFAMWRVPPGDMREMCGALDAKIPKFSSSRVGEERMKLNLGNSAQAGLSAAGWHLGYTKNRFLREERVFQKG